MASKSAGKGATEASKSLAEAAPGSLEQLATDFLVARIHQFLVSYGEPARLSDIAQGLVNDGASVSLVRTALQQYPSRFIAVDRRWDVRSRYLDRQRPTSKLLEEIVASYDAPIAAWDASHELGLVIGRSAEGTRPVAERLLKSADTYVPLIEQGVEVKYGLKSWLLDVSSYNSDTDILFYNFLPADADGVYKSVSTDWEKDPVGSALTVIAATPGAAPKSVDNRLMLYLAWKQLEDDYEDAEIFNALVTSGRCFMLPGHRWTDQAGLDAIRAELSRIAERIGDMPEEDLNGAEESTPLNIAANDLEEMFRIVTASDEALSATRLLEELYDITPGERTYVQDLQVVVDTLKSHSNRFLWVGYDRFRAAGSLPAYIGMVPESLQFPATPQLADENEDVFDQLLEDEGFERGLDRDIRNPIAMDVGDQDPAEMVIWPEGDSGESRLIRLILKAHHKEIGTFPICQIPPGFLPAEPQVIELTLRDGRGGEHQVFADAETQLIYGIGLFDLYSGIAAESGAVFFLEKTASPGELRFINNNETDDNIYISPERMEQLQNYRGEVESGPATATYDLVRYILEHTNQAMSYMALLAELNIVRRTTRRQLASILSGWAGFSAKGGLWSYDAKKGATGYNKNKRKYII